MIGAAFAAFCVLVYAVITGSGSVRSRWLIGFVLYVLGDMLVLVVIPHMLHLRIGHWNWTGKMLSIALSFTVLVGLRLSRREVALVLPSTRSAWVWSAGLVLVGVVAGVTMAYLFRDHQPPDLETLLFQATMPGLDEELMFRGVGFALLARGFVGRGAAWAPLMTTSLLFGFVHVVFASGGRLQVDLAPLVFVLPFGFLLGWLRMRSGSLLGPVLGHNLANSLGTLASGLP